MDFQALVRDEIESSRAKWGTFKNTHEAYAVLLEELDEFWAEVKQKEPYRVKCRQVAELVQIAAIAQRTAEDLLT